MTYTYDDVLTAKDIVTGRVKEEDIIGKKGIFIDSFPDDMSRDTLLKTGYEGKLIRFNGSYKLPFWGDDDTKWSYFIPNKEESLGLRFKVGDRVKYGLAIATVVRVDRSDPPLTYRIQFDEGGLLWIRESDISPVEDKPASKSYEERQAEWVKANNIKVGDRVRILRGFEPYEDGADVSMNNVHEMDGLIGTIGEVRKIDPRSIGIWSTEHGCEWYWPFFVLEKVEYIPFDLSKPEDRDALRDKWIRCKNDGNEARISAFRCDPHTSTWRAYVYHTGLRGGSQLLSDYEFLDGSVIGKPANGRQMR